MSETHSQQGIRGPSEVELRGATGGRSTPELVREAVDQAGQLISGEIRLAKQELGESMHTGVVALVAGVAAVAGLLAFLVMAVVTVVIAVGLHWAAALGFALLFLVVAATGAMVAMSRLRRLSPLRQTVETVKEDVEWAKQQLTRDAR